jgi:hypothetical protein
LENGFAGGRYDAERFAEHAAAAGYRWILMEWNAYDNSSRGAEVRAACTNNNLMFAIWMTRGFTATDALQACLDSGADGFISEGEIPAEKPDGSMNPQAQDWPALVTALDGLAISKGVATNWAPFVHGDGTPAPEYAKPLVEASWHCLPYVYPSEHAGITPERQQFYAQHFTHNGSPTIIDSGYGWYETEPVLGCYGGYTLDDFPTRDEYVGWSVWAAEYVL